MPKICLFVLTFNLSDKLGLKRTSKKREIVKRKSLSISAKLAVARIEAYESFSDLLPALVSTMETISTEAEWNK